MIIFGIYSVLTTLPLDYTSLFVDLLWTVGPEGCEYSDRLIINCNIRPMLGSLRLDYPSNIFSLQEQKNDIPAVIEDIYVTNFSVLLGLELSISFSYRNVFGIQYFQFIHRYIRICNRT